MDGGSSERIAKLMKMHRGYDYVVSASDVTAGHFSEAFRTDRARVAKYGLPRIDYIKSVSSGERRDEMRSKIYATYPELENSDRKLVLYAPTFRRDRAVDVRSLADRLDPDKYDLVVKLHPLYRGDADAFRPTSDVRAIYDETFSSYDWLSIADVIISDYSSFVIEATLADKPLYIYVYDLDAYEANTGLNIDFRSEAIAPYVSGSADELAETLGGEYDMNSLRAFRDRYIDIDTENCTAALADFIESLA